MSRLTRKCLMRADEKMPDDFYDWLEECPVMWTRGKVGNETVGYFFHCNNDDEEASDE